MSESPEFTINNGVLRNYLGPGGSVTVPEGVTSIDCDAFFCCEGLEEITLPESLTSILDGAFQGCRSLRTVRLPEGVTQVGEDAFRDCGSLESLALPGSLKRVGSCAFRDCRSLRSVSYPGGRVRFGEGVFSGCTALADGRGFFILADILCRYFGEAEHAAVPEGVKRIAEMAFAGCSRLVSVTLPEGLREIGNGAFNSCGRLESVSLPESLREIGVAAFSSCEELRQLRLPEGLRRLGTAAFRGCRSLRTLILPEGIRHVREEAFAYCEALESISLPEDLRSIGRSAFRQCLSLQTLRWPTGEVRIAPDAFRDCPMLADGEGFLIVDGRLIAYYGSGGDVTVPEGVREIEGHAFSKSGVTSVALPESLEAIGSFAFEACGDLTSVVFPKRPLRFGAGVFFNCPGLADGDGFFAAGGILFLYAGPGGDVIVPEGVTHIDHFALADLQEPVRISLPDSVTSVDSGAFYKNHITIRVRRWFPALSQAVKGCDVRAILTETTAGLPAALRRAARYGAALWPEAAYDAGQAREDAAWLSQHAAAILEDAFRMPELLHFLCAHRLIPPPDADAYLEEARERGTLETTALLMDYVNALGMETVEQAREERQKREESAAASRTRRAAKRPHSAFGHHFGISGLHIAPDDDNVSHWFWDCPSMAELKKRLAESGAILQKEINSRTDYLLSDDSSGKSRQCQRAVLLGIPVISSEELWRMENEFW